MQREFKTYMAGVATAGFAIAAGFGGGIFIANNLDTRSAVPAPGMSRIERTKREEPKLAAAVENPAQGPVAEEPPVNPLAEAQPLRANVARPNVANVEPVPMPAIGPSARQIALQPDRPPLAAAMPAAMQAIASPRTEHRNLRRSRHVEPLRAPDEPPVRATPRDSTPRKRAIARREEPGGGQREVARYREGNVRYVVRTEDGRPANPAEVDQLKRELRDRREGRIVETRALSYGAEPRGVFPQIFR